MNPAQTSSLRYAETGNGSAVVLLHPIAMRLEFWAPVAERLCRTNRVDLARPEGPRRERTRRRPLHDPDLANDVIALVRALDLKQAYFVGCSLGGMVGQAIALGAPELVSGLVLANTTHAMTEQSREVMLQRAKATERGAGAHGRRRHRALVLARLSRDAGRDRGPGATLGSGQRQARRRQRLAGHRRPRPSRGGRRNQAARSVVTTGSLDPASPPEQARAMARDFRHARFRRNPGRRALFAARASRCLCRSRSRRRGVSELVRTGRARRNDELPHFRGEHE